MKPDSKEKILVELRQYHLDAFPEKLATETMDKYWVEFRLLQDKVISMILGYVERKTVFVDFSAELMTFKNKVTPTNLKDISERNNRKSFATKSEALLRILKMAYEAKFTIQSRRVYGRAATKTVAPKGS